MVAIAAGSAAAPPFNPQPPHFSGAFAVADIACSPANTYEAGVGFRHCSWCWGRTASEAVKAPSHATLPSRCGGRNIKRINGTSLVRLRLAMQGMWVRSLVGEPRSHPLQSN